MRLRLLPLLLLVLPNGAVGVVVGDGGSGGKVGPRQGRKVLLVRDPVPVRPLLTTRSRVATR